MKFTETPSQSISDFAGEGVNLTVEQSVVVNRGASDLYWFWRTLANLPRFMPNLLSVHESGLVSYWMARTDSGKSVEWTSRIIEEQPPKVLSWRWVTGRTLSNTASVWFSHSSQDETVVKAVFKYSLPNRPDMNVILNSLSLAAEQQLAQALRNFKNLMENESGLKNNPQLASSNRFHCE